VCTISDASEIAKDSLLLRPRSFDIRLDMKGLILFPPIVREYFIALSRVWLPIFSLI
jgi:hypothetical protein